MSMVKKLRYVEYSTIATGAAGQPGTLIYRANGPYDPSYAVGGHQPLLWDTYSAMYNHHVVLGAKIKATFWSETAGTTYNAVVVSRIDDDASVALNLGTVLEHGPKFTKYKFIRTNPASSKDTQSISQVFSARKFFGVKDVVDNKQDIGALVTTTPTDAAYFVLYVQHPDGTTNIGTLRALITIEYLIQFSEPRDIGTS